MGLVDCSTLIARLSIKRKERNRALLWQEQTQPTLLYKRKHFLFYLRDLCFARSGIIAAIPITLVTFFMFCGTTWTLFMPATDPARYQCYALSFWFGGDTIRLLPHTHCAFLSKSVDLPFQMLPTEYPPLTLAVFSLPILLPVAYYQFAFALLMSFVAMVGYWLLQRYGPRGSAFMFALYLLLGALALAQIRYDLLPALCTLLCIIAAERKRWSIAYIALAFGVLLKLYPILLLPALMIAEQQSRGRLTQVPSSLSFWETLRELRNALLGIFQWRWWNCLLFTGIVGGITGLFALINVHDAVISQIEYFRHRPLQIEATGSTVLWIATHLGIPWDGIRYDFGSINILSPFGNTISTMGTLGLLLGVIGVLWLQWRSRLDLTQTAIALILLFIATGKVFSPQYLIWVIPLLAYAGAFDRFWLFFWGSTSLLTSIHYIFINSRLPSTQTALEFTALPAGFFEIIGVRNLFFVFVTLAYLFNWFQARQRRPCVPSRVVREA